MRKFILTLIVLSISFVAVWAQEGFTQIGKATYYHKKFEGRKTTSGERYRSRLYTAAHRTLPFGTMVKVTNMKTGKWLIVKINDRGPFVRGRIIDLSLSAARKLDLVKHGSYKVKIKVVTSVNSHLKNDIPVECDSTLDNKYFKISVSESKPRGYGVQIASFNDYGNLLQFISRVEKIVPEKLTIQVSKEKEKRIYRVVIGEFDNKALADSYAEKMANDFQGCYSIEYQNYAQ